MKIVLLSCTKSKLDKKSQAKDLYSASPMFQKTLKYGESLKPFQKLITESKTSVIDLFEMKKQALDEEIVDDFILYIQNS
jgi:hypothetical protein